MKGMKSIGKVGIRGELYEIILASKLQENFECMASEGRIYFRKDRSIESMVKSLLGFYSRQYRTGIFDRTPRYTEWDEGLCVGKRSIRVQIVESGTEPYEWHLDLDENILLILGDRHIFTVIQRAANAAGETFREWERRAVRRAYRKEKPRFQPDVPYVLDSTEIGRASCRER